MKKKIISVTLDEDVIQWVDEVSKNLEMSRSEFLNMTLSGGRDANGLVEKVIDSWFDQKKADAKSKLQLTSLLQSPRKGAAE
jgi:hypothetical protein